MDPEFKSRSDSKLHAFCATPCCLSSFFVLERPREHHHSPNYLDTSFSLPVCLLLWAASSRWGGAYCFPDFLIHSLIHTSFIQSKALFVPWEGKVSRGQGSWLLVHSCITSTLYIPDTKMFDESFLSKWIWQIFIDVFQRPGNRDSKRSKTEVLA